MYQLCNGHGFYTLILLPNLLIHENAEKIVQKNVTRTKRKIPENTLRSQFNGVHAQLNAVMQ